MSKILQTSAPPVGICVPITNTTIAMMVGHKRSVAVHGLLVFDTVEPALEPDILRFQIAPVRLVVWVPMRFTTVILEPLEQNAPLVMGVTKPRRWPCVVAIIHSVEMESLIRSKKNAMTVIVPMPILVSMCVISVCLVVVEPTAVGELDFNPSISLNTVSF